MGDWLRKNASVLTLLVALGGSVVGFAMKIGAMEEHLHNTDLNVQRLEGSRHR